MKMNGVLMPLFTLPGKYGIGEFSKEAYSFIRLLKKYDFNVWQMLPLNPVAYGNSPYQSYSSYALEELYLPLDDLYKEGLISKPRRFRYESHLNYDAVRAFKKKYYFEAYENVLKNKNYIKRLKKFQIDNPRIDEYATFMARKEINDGKAWNEWNKVDEKREQYLKFYYIFLQYRVLISYNKLHKYAKKMGIALIGDVPFYVGYDSSDVYFHKELFLLDKDNVSTLVAGVPPDCFSTLGQRWGNPIYNFEKMKEDNYSFLVDRIGYAGKLYDYVRLDHFRAFDSYYVIPHIYDDARIGEWRYAPGYEIFDALYNKYPSINLIAEDLGDLRPEVYTLKEHYHLPGMNILEFTIFDYMRGRAIQSDDKYLISYIGTHDNDTVAGWYKDFVSKEDRPKIHDYLMTFNVKGDNTFDRFISFTYTYFYNAIVSFSDFLHLGSRGKVNSPSTISNDNWSIRIKDFKKLRKAFNKHLNISK